MQLKTTAIVLHSIKYSDSATIVTMYTHHFGRVAYMVYGVNKKKAVCRPAYLQALSILELDVIHTPGKEIQQIKDIRVAYPLTCISKDPYKNAIALFLSEILYRTIHLAEPDESIFRFLENSIQQLDCCEPGLANFHLVFMLKLTRYLGFEPNKDEEEKIYFDLMNGVFTKIKPLHLHYLMPEDTELFSALLHADYTNMYSLAFSREKRFKMLESMVEFYRLHVPDFHDLHSLEVLKTLFDE